MKYVKTFEQSVNISLLKQLNIVKDKSVVKQLNLSNKDLTKLPNLSKYTNLEVLDCNFNQLTSLPKLPDTLERLYCMNNKLTSLPKLPKNLEYLECFNNKLTSLPELPDTLYRLSCFDNNLTSLPELPDTLIKLNCGGNQLPFEDLKGYKKWYQENKHIIDREGLKNAYHLSQDINKYNL